MSQEILSLNIQRIAAAKLFPQIEGLSKKAAKGLHSAIAKYSLDLAHTDVVRKAFRDPDPDPKPSERALVSHVSTGGIDLEGEVLIQTGCIQDFYSKIVLYVHDYTGRYLPIGTCLWQINDGGYLKAKTLFAKHQLAEDLYHLYTDPNDGVGPICRDWSIGYIPLRTVNRGARGWADAYALAVKLRPDLQGKEDAIARIVTEWLELEYSATPIGVNPECKSIIEGKGLTLVSTPYLAEQIRLMLHPKAEEETELPPAPPVEPPVETPAPAAPPASPAEEPPPAEPASVARKSFGEGVREPESWNRAFGKSLDIATLPSTSESHIYDVWSKFLDCQVKDVFRIADEIPSAQMGNMLSAYAAICGDFELVDTRNLGAGVGETPPEYRMIQLKRDLQREFLVDGMRFYQTGKRRLVVDFTPQWWGVDVTIATKFEDRAFARDLISAAYQWVAKNNFLRGEKFCLSGEFLESTGEQWQDLILEPKTADILRQTASTFASKGVAAPCRGILMVGRPGTGKTKTGRVLLNTLAEETFIWISSRDFRVVYPPHALALAFDMARSLAPSVLFFEDIDGWLDGMMIDLLKTEMDGIRQSSGVLTCLTSNTPERLPDALLDRPGRFHHVLDFKLPDVTQRAKMLLLWAGKIENQTMTRLLEMTDGFSGAHMKEIVEYAKIIADERSIGVGQALLMSLEQLIEQKELIAELKAGSLQGKAFTEALSKAMIGRKNAKEHRQPPAPATGVDAGGAGAPAGATQPGGAPKDPPILTPLPAVDLKVALAERSKSMQKSIKGKGMQEWLQYMNYTLPIFSPIDAGVARGIVDWLLGSAIINPEQELTLIINSPGGCCSDGFAVIDTMEYIPNPVRTVGLGEVSSMGLLIFMAGDNRVIGESSVGLSHRFWTCFCGSQAEIEANKVKWDNLYSRMILHYQKYSAFKTQPEIEANLLREVDVYLDAEGMLKAGLADEKLSPSVKFGELPPPPETPEPPAAEAIEGKGGRVPKPISKGMVEQMIDRAGELLDMLEGLSERAPEEPACAHDHDDPPASGKVRLIIPEAKAPELTAEQIAAAVSKADLSGALKGLALNIVRAAKGEIIR